MAWAIQALLLGPEENRARCMRTQPAESDVHIFSRPQKNARFHLSGIRENLRPAHWNISSLSDHQRRESAEYSSTKEYRQPGREGRQSGEAKNSGKSPPVHRLSVFCLRSLLMASSLHFSEACLRLSLNALLVAKARQNRQARIFRISGIAG